MQTRLLVHFLTVVFILSLAACTLPQPEPSSTPVPTQAVLSTATAASTGTPQSPATPPLKTATALPSAVPFSVTFYPRQYASAGGFSITPPFDFPFQVIEKQAVVQNEEGSITISFYGELAPPVSQLPQEIVDSFVSTLMDRTGGVYNLGPGEPIDVDGAQGQSFNLDGYLGDFPFKGKAVALLVSEDQYLFGMVIANIEDDETLWSSQGEELFDSILHTVEFASVVPGDELCPVSTDPTYGSIQENPIKVGGDWMDGPARERGYLDVLRGPNGENVSYERTGSELVGDVILDIFEITIAGQSEKKTLYVDEYNYEAPKAPVGFSCSSPIPLQAP